MMKRICVLEKLYNDGTKTVVEFVNEDIPNHNRMVVHRFSYDGSKTVSVYRGLNDVRLQRDILLHKENGYHEK